VCKRTKTAVGFNSRSIVWLGTDLVNVLPYAAQIRVPILFISGTRD